MSVLEKECNSLPAKHSLAGALRGNGLSLIAEFKRSSPGHGVINNGAAVDQVCRAYQRGGAAAVSILTCKPFFSGSFADLSAARESCELPLLCKDFILDEYQILEAARAGADAILLIIGILDDHQLRQFSQTATDLNLDCLIEAHTREDLARMDDYAGGLIGINNRDLSTGKISPGNAEKLLASISAGTTVVAESGYSTPEEMRDLWTRGVDGVLMGTNLMLSDSPERTIQSLALEALF